MIRFRIEKVSLKQPLPGPVGLAIILLVASAYVLIDIVTQPNAVAFLIPPQS